MHKSFAPKRKDHTSAKENTASLKIVMRKNGG